MQTRQDIVIFDIDGTLADVSARLHHLEKRPKNWKAFFAGIAEDPAITPMVHLCNTLFAAGFHVILCTGRPDNLRGVSKAWLAREGVQYHELYMRAVNDRRSDVEVKRDLLAHLDKSRVAFVVEDRDRVVEMWRQEGLMCLQCASGAF